jgi:hypothetical protein
MATPQKTAAQYRDRAHARIYTNWANLPAWRKLSAPSVALLVELLMQYRPSQPNWFVISERKAAGLARCARAKAAGVLDELVDKGWLQVERVGTGLKGGTARRAAAYSLTNFPTDAGPATRLFERWQPLHTNK